MTPTIQSRLQTASDRYVRYFQKWKVQVNGSKSEATLFSRKTARRHQPTLSVKIGNDGVPWRSSLKYLGMTLDRRLTFKDHIQGHIGRSELVTRSLYSIVNRGSRLNLKHRLHLFKSVFRPRFSYGAPLLAGCAAIHKKSLPSGAHV